MLGPPHTHHLAAAEGWLELGNVAEAMAELEQIPAALQNHAHVLEVRWQLCAAKKDWPGALDRAQKQIETAPEWLSGWVHRAYALRRTETGGLQAAWDALFPAMERFPAEAIVPYNLACYACQMQQLDVARVMFKRALGLGDSNQLKRMALSDPDLEPLWAELREL